MPVPPEEVLGSMLGASLLTMPEARESSGSGPRRMMICCHSALPGNLPAPNDASNAGSPALASDDFPLPDGPMMLRNRVSPAPPRP